MRILLTSLLSIALLIGCKKDETQVAALNPDLTAGLTGEYPLTYYREGAQSINLPTKDVSGKFIIQKVDLTHINARLTITSGGQTEDYSTNDFELQRDGKNANLYNIRISGQSVGTITANDIQVSANSPDGTVTEIKAKR